MSAATAQTMSNLNATPGGLVYFPDGSSTTVSATYTIECPNNFVGALLNAGWEFASTDSGSISNALSSNQSSATSTGLADSLSRSSATSGGQADSQSRSSALSAGASASVARSSITSGSV